MQNASEYPEPLTHPSWCAPELCWTGTADVGHSGLIEPMLPSPERNHVVSIRRRRGDELHDDGQVVWPEELELTIVAGKRHVTTHLSAQDTLAHGRRLVELGEQMIAAEGGAA